MAVIRDFLVVLILFCATHSSCQVKNAGERVTITDSLSVRKFIINSSVCNRIKYVEENDTLFASSKGYSELILQSITKESGKPLFLTIRNGGILESEKNKINMLREQLLEIKKSLKCK